MVTNIRNKSNKIMSVKHSIMVWVVGAVLGWVVAVGSVYNSMNSEQQMIAQEIKGTNIRTGSPKDLNAVETAAGSNKDQDTKDKD